MFMIITAPWPVPSANAELAELVTAEAATHIPDAMAETGAIRPAQIEDLVSWTCRERLRLVWYRLRLAASASYRASRGPSKPRLKLP